METEHACAGPGKGRSDQRMNLYSGPLSMFGAKAEIAARGIPISEPGDGAV